MKKRIRTIASAMLLVFLFTVLSGCAETLSGTYTAEKLGTGTSYTFSGSDVRVDILVLGAVAASYVGTYEISDGRITFTFGDTEAEEAKQYSGTFDFAETETSVRIGMIEYQKEA